MTNPKRRTVPALMAGALGLGGALALAAEPTQQELLSQLQELQAKVAAMEAKQVNTQDVDSTVASVLADADRRSQLMQVEGFTAGYNKGKFVIQSADGNFTLNPWLQFQFRSVWNMYEQDEDVSGDDDDESDSGYEIARMKFGFAGNVFSPDIQYAFNWDSDTDGGGVYLQDAYVRNRIADAWAIRSGQFKDPVHHEELVSSKRQLAADRSLLNEVLGGGTTGRVQGVSVIYDDGGNVRAEVALHDGANSANTNFQDDFTYFDDDGDLIEVQRPDFGVGGRVEWMVSGDNWAAYEDFTAMGNDSDILVAGAGGDWTQMGDNDVYAHTLDVQWENSGGLGVYAAYVAALTELGDEIGGEDSFYDMGLLLQAGYMLNEQWEIFGRYDVIVFDDNRLSAADEDTFNEITVGVNYYLHGHGAKITIDGFYLLDGTPTSAEDIGILDSGEEDQFGVRAQFQLLI